MSLQRIAIISAVGSHSMMRNRTVYYERQQNETNFDRGINLQQHFNVFIGGAFLSFAITLLCVVCYCFNKIINKNSMALYRRHLMEAANQNVDIYTVEQFYETEAYAPLCETQSAQMPPPSYNDVMAAEKAILTKYAKLCTSTKCCEHSQSNRLNATSTTTTFAATTTTTTTTAEQSLPDAENNNAEQINITDHSTGTITTQQATEVASTEAAPELEATENGNTMPDANNQPTDSNVYDDNGNEIGCSQETPSMCCIPAHQNKANTCCCVQKDCSCVDNCSEHCTYVGNTIANMEITEASTANENVNPSSTRDDEVVVNVDDNDNKCATLADQVDAMDTNNNERTQVPSNKCQCTRHQHHHNHRNDSPVQFEVLSDNGIVRMDMSKIIDRTGLPTYDAAIKLESFGYV